MKEHKYPIPVWVWELRGRTLSFLKKWNDTKSVHKEYVDSRLKSKFNFDLQMSRIFYIKGKDS